MLAALGAERCERIIPMLRPGSGPARSVEEQAALRCRASCRGEGQCLEITGSLCTGPVALGGYTQEVGGRVTGVSGRRGGRGRQLAVHLRKLAAEGGRGDLLHEGAHSSDDVSRLTQLDK